MSFEQPCKHGRHCVSPKVPPQVWPQFNSFVHAVLPYSLKYLWLMELKRFGMEWNTWHSESAHTLPMANRPEFPVVPQNRQIPVTPAALVLVPPSLYSTKAFKVLESARAAQINQVYLVKCCQIWKTNRPYQEARIVWYDRNLRVALLLWLLLPPCIPTVFLIKA